MISKMIQIQTKPIINTHCNTDLMQGKIQSKYLNKHPDQGVSLRIDQSKAKFSRDTQWEIEIKFEYSNKDPNQAASLDIDQDKVRVSQDTQREIKIWTLALARIKSKLELVGTL